MQIVFRCGRMQPRNALNLHLITTTAALLARTMFGGLPFGCGGRFMLFFFTYIQPPSPSGGLVLGLVYQDKRSSDSMWE